LSHFKWKTLLIFEARTQNETDAKETRMSDAADVWVCLVGLQRLKSYSAAEKSLKLLL
jgi:hypothetical protein